MTINTLHLFNSLTKYVKADPKDGIDVGELLLFYNHVCTLEERETIPKVNNLLPLIEMYALCKGIHFSIERRNRSIKLKGFAFGSEDARKLCSVVANGLMSNSETAAFAETLYAKIKE